MSKIIVQHSRPLHGSISCSGSKNSALPILAATILTPGKNILYNIPHLTDIENMLEILESLGGKCDVHPDFISVDCTDCTDCLVPYTTAGKFRGSFFLAAPLLARFKKAQISMPGGCPIGNRPIDLHLKGFAALGADIKYGHGYVELSCKKLTGARIYLDFPSVGATENLIMAAVSADGETIIENAAAEPEIADLAEFLKKQGAQISGAGTDTVKICGVKHLTPCKHTIICDRIEAGTFMSAFAITRGKGEIKNVNPIHIKPITAKLSEMGAVISEAKNSVFIDADAPLHAVNIKTLPFPGFPTDMQSQFSSLLCTASGTGIIVETVFENRFLQASELNRMGASIHIDGRTCVIEGGKRLSGAKVCAADLRGGAALILAGLSAGGETEISGIEHIKRGYENICDKLSAVGGNIFLS